VLGADRLTRAAGRRLAVFTKAAVTGLGLSWGPADPGSRDRGPGTGGHGRARAAGFAAVTMVSSRRCRLDEPDRDRVRLTLGGLLLMR